ncbi:MAG: NUDIX domain-containing protein [Candidatus Gracilibacteria bacterium]
MAVHPSKKISNFTGLLMSWYERHGRNLPWRDTKDPYRIWVSEIMLQQTQVERVKDYYKKFLGRFPSVEDLAAASWEELMEYWRGLGYYRRARNMHRAAQMIMKDFGGKFPRTFEELKKLPGVGSYTAAAVASFAYGEKVPAIDTNIQRIFSRFFGQQWDCLGPADQFHFATQYIGQIGSREFNYALMDLGSAVCLARRPECEQCCFQKGCQFAPVSNSEPSPQRKNVYRLPGKLRNFVFAEGAAPSKNGVSRTNLLSAPVGAVGVGRLPSIKVAAGVLIHAGKVLIARRPKGKPLAGLWEFPGGKLEAGEDERKCLKREFMEELGVEVAVRPHFYKTITEHDGVQILLSFHRCSLLLGEITALEGQEFQWVSAGDLTRFEFPRANDEVVALLQEKKAMFYGG